MKDYDPKTQGDAFPKGEVITFEFPAKGKRGPVTLHWYSGTERIPRPKDMDEDDKNVETGAVVLGDKGTIVYGSSTCRIPAQNGEKTFSGYPYGHIGSKDQTAYYQWRMVKFHATN